MSALFGRRAKLIVAKPIADLKSTAPNAIELESVNGAGLRIVFRVKKSLDKEPNTARISIYNLAERTRAKLQGDGHRVILEAGYPETIATIFVGDTTRILHKQEGADWVTEIEAQDGRRAYAHSRASVSFSGGTRHSTVIRELVTRLGLPLAGALPELTGAFVHGFSWVGPAARALDDVLRGVGLEWSIQNNRVQILRPDAVTQAVVELGPDTGLVGAPEFGSSEKGKAPPVVTRALLSGRIVPGGKVKLNSNAFKGGFRVLAVDHDGDTSGGAWYTRFEAKPL